MMSNSFIVSNIGTLTISSSNLDGQARFATHSQGVIQDIEVEGGNKKNNQNIIFAKKRVNCYFNTLFYC